MKKLSIILCMLLLMCNASLATTYYENDVTPPWGKISIEGGTVSNGVTYVENENITVKIEATDDMCNKEEIKYYLSTSKIEGNTVINESDWKSLADGDTAEIKLASVSGVQHVYAVFKDLNGNTSFVSTNKNQTLKFDVNGGTNAPVGIGTTRYYGEPFTLTSQMPTKDGAYFIGWSTDPMATAPSFRGGDIIPADMVIAGDTLYAVYTTEIENLPVVSEKLEVSDKVNLSIPYSNVEVNGNKSNYTGWKVISENDDGSINLVSSGTPVTFYHGTNAQESIEALTTNFLTTLYDSNGFESSNLEEVFNSNYIKKDANGNPMVRALNAEDILKVTNKSQMELGSAMNLTQVSYGNIFDNDTDYWVATNNGSNNLYTINASGEVGVANNKEYGVRVVITIKGDIKAANRDVLDAWNVELNGTIVNVDGLGDIFVEGNKDAEFEYNPDTGELEGIIPPSEEPEEVPEIPEEKLNLIEFNYGKFEKNTSYTPGEYITVEYEETKTRAKTPVKYQNIIWSHWLITVDEDGNEISKEQIDIAITDCDKLYSNYVVYDLTPDESIIIDGVSGDTLMMHAIYNTSDDNQENAIYLAAYLNKYNNTKDYHVAKWNGSNYAKVDCDNDINAVTVFTENYIVTRTENVQVSKPTSSTEYVYIPVGTLKATEGMTWGEWLESDYNITGETDLRIKTPNFEDISYDAIIIEGGEYGLYKHVLAAGLYDANDNLLASWDTLVNEYGLDVSMDYTYSTSTTVATHINQVIANNNLTTGVKLIIGDGVTSIGEWAFGRCSSLTSVTIPDSVVSIGESAFENCRSLTSITIPNSVTSIADYCFCNCSRLTSVIIPDSITSIGAGAFGSCSSLTSVTIPDSITSIGESAFSECSGLTSIVIPDGVPSIGEACFYRCSLTNVTIPDSVTSIGFEAFAYCDSLTSVTIPDGVTSVGDSAFLECSSLTSVTIGNGVTSIKHWTFLYCIGLTSVTIGNSVTSIETNAFGGCSSLTSVKIPDSVTSIEKYAFGGCSGLTSVTFENTSGWFVSENSSATNGTNVDVTNPSTNATNLIDMYSSYYWKRNDLVAGLYDANDNLLASWDTLVNVYELDVSCDYDESELEGLLGMEPPEYHISQVISNNDLTSGVKLVIGDEVTYIGYLALSYCDSLTSVTLGSSVQDVSGSSFIYSPNLKDINIKADNPMYCSIDGVVYTKDKKKIVICPNGKTGELVIPNSVIGIEIEAFVECNNLTSVVFENTSGWYITIDNEANGGTNVDVTNPSANVLSLANKHTYYYWKTNSIQATTTYMDLIPSKANAPVLGEGMKAVYWSDENATTEYTADAYTSSMYNYTMGDGKTDSKDSKWANAITVEDGSYWVWIPRYAYKITYTADAKKTLVSDTKTQYGNIDILFMDGTSNTHYRDENGNSVLLPEGYKVHPSFQAMSTQEDLEANPLGKWDVELEGIWVAKYEASRETSTDNWATYTNGGTSNTLTTNAGNTSTTLSRVVSKPSVISWRYISQNNIYQNSLAMHSELNSHEMKNSEWGAVAYLTESAYGRNGNEIAVNQCSDYYTGAGPEIGTTAVFNSIYSYSASTFENTYAWNTEQGKLASTTGNIYGVYDMSGGAWEYVAAYTASGDSSNLTESSYGGVLGTTTDMKTKQVYVGYSYEANSNVYGDAVGETDSWYEDYSGFPGSNYPFFIRGGHFSIENSAGVFLFGNSFGSIEIVAGFRPVLCVVSGT